MTSFATLTHWTTMLVDVRDGGEIPKLGSAVHDGDLYVNRERRGRVLSISHQPGGVSITYLRAERA